MGPLMPAHHALRLVLVLVLVERVEPPVRRSGSGSRSRTWQQDTQEQQTDILELMISKFCALGGTSLPVCSRNHSKGCSTQGDRTLERSLTRDVVDYSASICSC